MMRSAYAAIKKLQKDLTNEYYQEKLLITRCYMQYVLPQCTSYSVAIEMGSELVIEQH